MSPEAFDEQLLALERPRDAQGNEDTRPSNDETVTFRSITVAEVYVGREADSLGAALGAIKWIESNEPVVGEIANARKEDGYYPTRFILASGPAPDLTLRGYGQVGLPDGIERIYGQSYVLGPSVVAAALTFVFTDAEAGRLDRALREDAESRIDKTRSPRRTRMTVYMVKSERVNSIRSELSERCLAWLKEKFPGTLVAGGRHGIPLCSLVSLAQGKPFQTQAEYMRLLELTNSFFASHFARPDYLFLTPRTGRTTRDTEFIAAFNEVDALSPGSYPDLSVTPEIVHEAISPFMMMHAMAAVLRSLESRMQGIRSDLEKLDFGSATDEQVVELRNKLLGLSRDIAIVCGDLATVVDDSFTFWPDYPLLIAVSPNQSSPAPSETTADGTRRNLRSHMKDVRAEETALRELVLVTSQSISDANNTKLQGKLLALTDKLGRLTVWLVILTVVVLALTVASVIIGALQLANSGSSGTSNPSVTPHTSTSATRAPTATPKTVSAPKPTSS